tara:strand:- start:391 stop:1119 length:729 start_codon:yes stop_codon:yes gene_type:complete
MVELSSKEYRRKFEKLQAIIGYQFNDVGLLHEALVHPSIIVRNDQGRVLNYERLEFLGDSVLSLVIAEILMELYPDDAEGPLAKRQSALVKGESLALIANKLNIGHYLIMTAGEESIGGRSNPSNIENALEAIIGAIFADSGRLPEVREFIRMHFQPLAAAMVNPPKDPKTALQEWAQSRGMEIPLYEMIESTGPAHSPLFTVQLNIDQIGQVTATGESKKKAEKDAARQMLDIINQNQAQS